MTAVIRLLPDNQGALLCIGDGVGDCKLRATLEAVNDDGATVPCCNNRDCQGLAHKTAIEKSQPMSHIAI